MNTSTKIDGLTQLAKLAEKQFEAETAVDQAEFELSAAKTTLRSFAEKQIPDLMEELEIESYETKDGLKIEIKETPRANLAKIRLAEGLEWLRDNGHGGLIKTAVTVPFSKGGDEDAQLLVDRLRGEGLIASYESKVHHSTLTSAVTTMLEEGQDVPFDLFSVIVQRIAKLTMKKL